MEKGQRVAESKTCSPSLGWVLSEAVAPGKAGPKSGFQTGFPLSPTPLLPWTSHKWECYSSGTHLKASWTKLFSCPSAHLPKRCSGHWSAPGLWALAHLWLG